MESEKLFKNIHERYGKELFSLRLEKEMKKKLQKEAENLGVSLNALIKVKLGGFSKNREDKSE